MNAKRIIARLDIKANRLIKGIHLEGWRFLEGEPKDFCKHYYEEGADEILYIDSVASLYNRDVIKEIIKQTTKNVFVPITVGGGIRTVEDAGDILRSGADKIAINSQALKTPEIISEIANRFGSQCMVLSIQAKRASNGVWEAWYDSARERTNLDVIKWAKEGVERGAGEILLTSIDNEGTEKGFDHDLVSEVSSAVNVPVIASGGFGKISDFINVAKTGGADAVAIARSLHYKKISIRDIKNVAIEHGINVRMERKELYTQLIEKILSEEIKTIPSILSDSSQEFLLRKKNGIENISIGK